MGAKKKAKHKALPHVLPDRLDKPEFSLFLDSVATRKELDKLFYSYLLHETDEDRGKIEKSMYCFNHPKFREHYTVQEHKDRLFLDSRSRLCKNHHWCSNCASRRATISAFKLACKLRSLLSEYPGYDLLFVTLTIKNRASIADAFNHLIGAWRKMVNYRRTFLKQGTGYTPLAHTIGGFGGFETKRGAGGQWHPHRHSIFLTKRSTLQYEKLNRKGKDVYVPTAFEEALRNEWYRVTGDSFVVDVRRIEAVNDNDLLLACLETCKYALKTVDMSPKDRYEAYKVIGRRKLQSSFGCFHGYTVVDAYDLGSSLEALKGTPYYLHYLKFIHNGGFFEHERTEHHDYYDPASFGDEENEGDVPRLRPSEAYLLEKDKLREALDLVKTIRDRYRRAV